MSIKIKAPIAACLYVKKQQHLRYLRLIVTMVGVLFWGVPASAEVLVPQNAVWKYSASNQYPDAGWFQPTYNDASWDTGQGILGYGESYISTVVPFGPDPTSKYMTTCFRHTFEPTADSETITNLLLSVTYDDGFVMYLNGQEIVRRSMPPGEINYGTLAYSHEGGTYETIDISDYAGLLADGPNTLAVEVHQRSGTSSDLVWDAEMSTNANLIGFMWSGAITPFSAKVKAKIAIENAVCRLIVSDSQNLSSPKYSDPDTSLEAVNNRVVTLKLEGLEPGTTHYYGVEVEGVIDSGMIGQFHTFPEGEVSFTFAFASCAWTGSNHTVFDTIRSLNPLFFFHLGDFHYENIAVNDRDVFRQAYEAVLGSPRQSDLYRTIPLVYMWDDHDFGPNNSDSTAPGRQAARLTYQEYAPHYPLMAGSGDVAIYQAFSVGRVRFIVCDSRSARSPWQAADTPDKTMLGTTQKEWFKEELIHARDNYELTVWVNTLPWIGDTGDDGWYVYTHERRELADFIKANDITNLCMISGDAHMLAIDDGTNSDYADNGGAAFPVMHAAPLDRTPSIKGGPYSHGAYAGNGRGQFGLMSITDTGDSILVDWSGRYLGQEIMSYSFAYEVPTTSIATVILEPDTLHIKLAHTIEPAVVTLTIGDFVDGHTVADVDLSSVVVNDSWEPFQVEVISFHPDLNGAALELRFYAADLIDSYMPLYDTTTASLLVAGSFADGETWVISEEPVFIGHRPGDINLDGDINVIDLTYMVDWMFRGGSAPQEVYTADMQADGVMDVNDVVEIVRFLFL